MAGEAEINFTGNTTGPAELRFTPSGAAVTNFTVAVTGRKKVGDQWQDDGTAFYRCAVWRDMAEHVAESLDRSGIRVFVKGRLKPREYQASDGANRTSLDIDVDDCGPSLRFGSVTVPPKAERGAGGGYGGSQDRGGRTGGQGGSQVADDPWSNGPVTVGVGSQGRQTDEPPF